VDLQKRYRGAASADLLVEQAETVLLSGRLKEARVLFDEASAVAERSGDQVAFAVAALRMGGVWVNEHRDPTEQVRVANTQRRALAGLGEESPSLRLRLQTRLKAEEVYQGAPLEELLDDGGLPALPCPR